ncbi:DUF2062 domain-containing protein [Rubripirellula amarantea]|uniref:DUF2062 domain-containing protein n=1 Tax=Rubripirellula amarantea TaxID=2527999 RepID=A0A5C5WPT3_9BACT|nr:DUF2062 domain-containing protein [Rubripirellula amarantea]MDA8745327.1 DUF2062 domain-containing protein [Rubripirellula amarantea]TWT52577.1 hypothetical protein Pla22_02010 [Rubripirellula amarantea]
MILWTIKLIGFVRKAIAGRKYPSQLAWAVAFGVLLGIVPHGNLLAVAILFVVLSLRLNHAMAALTAVGVSFLATKLDPVSHTLGETMLNHEKISPIAMQVWEFPMVPWTDLNNTVVLGSFTIGLVALLPIFLITYPVFRMFAPKVNAQDETEQGDLGEAKATTKKRRQRSSSDEITYVDHGQVGVPSPRRDQQDQPSPRPTRSEKADGEPIHFVEIQRTDPPVGIAAPASHSDHRSTVETRIDVIRVKDSADAHQNSSDTSASPVADRKVADNEAQPMDEALNYLLRQLRDSQQRNVA